MTNVAAPALSLPSRRRIDLASAEAVTRVRRRYRAEMRFRFYGLMAIAFAAIFLVVLLFDIILKAIPAFTEYSLRLAMPVSAEAVDPTNSRDPAIIAARGDFDQVVREGLFAAFPEVTGRGERRTLEGILSSGAADVVRAMIARDPALVGGTITAPVRLSSDADLYLKGISTKTQSVQGAGIATPSATTGAVTIFSTANAFVEQLQVVKALMRENAKAQQRLAERTATVLRSVEGDIKVVGERLQAARATPDETRSKQLEGRLSALQADKANLERQVAEARSKAEDLNNRYERSGFAEDLDSRMPSLLVSINGGIVKASKLGGDRIEGEALVPLADTKDAQPAQWHKIILETPEDSRKIQDRSVAYLEKLREIGAVQRGLNYAFFTTGDSREPEIAGILGALVGSAYTMLVTLVLCLPIGVLAAIYLEEFAPKNRFTYLVEVNINNLAAVPSIVFGLLGLAMFLNFFGLPRSSPLVGGLVLALLVLPTIIIASRAALKAVPPSIREAALGVGASHQQAVFHHVLPPAMPGVLTGTIIGMAHALGETAPLLMIGMIAFIVDVPARVTDAATVLPVQIFLWSDLPEVGFQAKTAAAIIVLLLFLFVMNGAAIWLRKRFERRW
jgi:phosphate transport system permease protein